MDLTRREFVTTLGVLASALGLSQTDMAKVVEAFGHASPAAAPTVWSGAWTNKPKVIWVHGAECTGCSTSVVGLIEDATGVAVPGATSATDISTAAALGIITGSTATGAVAKLTDTLSGTHPNGHRTLDHLGLNVDGSAYAVNIADVLIDFIDLQYHETIMAAGGDGAYAYLRTEMDKAIAAPGAFVLVVEGAVQDIDNAGYWKKTKTATSAPWCSIAKNGTANAVTNATNELSFDDVVATLAAKDACKAVVAIGQCASFGGYPACIGPDLTAISGSTTKSQTGAKGVFDFLIDSGLYGTASAPTGAAAKVINVPGCPVNPWWFVLTVVAWLVDAVTATPATDTATATGSLGILNGALKVKGGVDSQRRLTAVYGNLLHGKYCPRYVDYAMRRFATKPGEFLAGSAAGGCLKNIGCKGLSTMSSCGRHGWNAQQPQNSGMNTAVEALAYKAADNTTKLGGCCLTAGAPCMGCTEKGYPDAFTPFVVR